MLFMIDIQNDFFHQEKGKMPVKDADKLLDGIIDRIKIYEDKKDKIFYTLNIHENMPDDKRSKQEKIWGQSVYDPLKKYVEKHRELKKVYYGIRPEESNMIKKRYTDQSYVDTIEIFGVETDICVLSNAIIIQNIFPESKIIINSSLCKSNNNSYQYQALEIMKNLKMEVI